MEYCEFYLNNKAKFGNELEKDLLICNEDCPYGNQQELTLGETTSTCKTKGLIKDIKTNKTDLFNGYFKGNSFHLED